MKENNQAEKTPLQLHLEQLFKDMRPDDAAPEHVKKDVFDTIDTLETVSDVLELFTGKFGETEAGFLDLLEGRED